MIDEAAIRAYLSRVLGWSEEQRQAVESAFLSIRLHVAHCVALVLLGDADLVSVARALHVRVFGAERPFVIADPRRGDMPASVRSPESRGTGRGALHAARGGTLALRLRRLPDDISLTIGMLREPGADVRAVILGEARYDTRPRAGAHRGRVRPDAVVALGAGPACFTEEDRAWVLRYSAESLAAIERATLRRVALRSAKNTDEAAAAVGMAGAALRKWRSKRRLRRGGGGDGVRSLGGWMRRVA